MKPEAEQEEADLEEIISSRFEIEEEDEDGERAIEEEEDNMPDLSEELQGPEVDLFEPEYRSKRGRKKGMGKKG